MLIDTHCHIHDVDYSLPVDEVVARAAEAGVEKMICVGTDEKSSQDALDFAAAHSNIYAAIGVHPHHTGKGYREIGELTTRYLGRAVQVVSTRGTQSVEQPENVLTESGTFSARNGADDRTQLDGEQGEHEQNSKLVAIGEIGLDYFYTHSPREMQIPALEAQLQVAFDHNLPVIFHVREAFDDFWPIFDNFPGIRGELHSFTDNQANLDQGLKRGLYIGVNGISTFTKDTAQKELFAHIPLDKLLLETDAPFLTPVPKRGKVNEPAFVRYVAMHHATIRGITPEEIANATSTNASTLFAI